jgi:hypothetical protein
MTNHNLNTTKGFPQQLHFTQESADFLTQNEVEVGDTYEIGMSMYEVIKVIEQRETKMIFYGLSFPVIFNRVESIHVRTL